jgi:exopolysaccharide production protein ExoQ
MTATLATVAFGLLIVALFVLDRVPSQRTSGAVWLPVLWLSLALSRPLSGWLSVIGLIDGSTVDSPESYAEGSPLDRHILTVMLAIGIGILCQRRHRLVALLRDNLPIVVFVLYALVSVVWSDYPDVAIKRWVRAQGHIVMILVVLTEKYQALAVRQLFSRTAFLLVPISVLAIKCYPQMGRYYDTFSWHPVVCGVTTNKNELGMLCLLLGLPAVYNIFIRRSAYSVSRRRLQHLLPHCVILAMIAWLFRMADSMTSQSCFLMGSCLIAVASLKVTRRYPVVLHATAIAIFLVATSALFLNMFGGALQSMGRNSSLTGRTDLWDTVLEFSGNPLFGTGFGSFWHGERLAKIWDIYWFHPVQAHSGYLETYLNLGYIGLTLLIVVIVAAYRSVHIDFRSKQETASLRFAYLVIAAIYNITEAAFGGAMWFVFLLGCMRVSCAVSRAAPAPLAGQECEDNDFVTAEAPALRLR